MPNVSALGAGDGEEAWRNAFDVDLMHTVRTVEAALIRYAAGQASQLASQGIRVNVVSPGTIYAADGFWGQVERDNAELFEQAVAWNPMGRMGTPGEVARALAFLASPAASFITGTNLLIDGGLTRGVQF